MEGHRINLPASEHRLKSFEALQDGEEKIDKLAISIRGSRESGGPFRGKRDSVPSPRRPSQWAATAGSGRPFLHRVGGSNPVIPDPPTTVVVRPVGEPVFDSYPSERPPLLPKPRVYPDLQPRYHRVQHTSSTVS
ncbi:hypothetical protein VTN96DRAFT_7979 [Rasamsonia emersonii]